eukprot:3683783-Lingulodinium_polyedra.AAC.1
MPSSTAPCSTMSRCSWALRRMKATSRKRRARLIVIGLGQWTWLARSTAKDITSGGKHCRLRSSTVFRGVGP